MSIFRSEQFVVALDAPHLRKIFQIQFGTRDGSLFVNFPYFRHTDGIASVVSVPAGEPSQQVSLEPEGKITSHLVKYSHHPDGRAHFSQDGKIRTVIRKRSVPLTDIEGHVFTVLVQGLSAFDALDGDDLTGPPSRKRTVIKFGLTGQEPGALKFVGWFYPASTLRRRFPDGMLHGATKVVSTDGLARTAIVCSPPAGRAGEHRCLVVSLEAIPRFQGPNESLLMFIGGFDTAPVANDLSVPTTFLVALYPAVDAEDLRARLGSIDFTSDSESPA